MKDLLTWTPTPLRTAWGEGMVEAYVELSKDHTMRIVVEKEALPLMVAALAHLLSGVSA
jgi:hypothetical protein